MVLLAFTQPMAQEGVTLSPDKPISCEQWRDGDYATINAAYDVCAASPMPDAGCYAAWLAAAAAIELMYVTCKSKYPDVP